MGCENLGSFVKSLSLLVSKKTRPSIRPPDGNPVHRVFRWYCIGSGLSRSYSFLLEIKHAKRKEVDSAED